jgi:histidyl-tRNA synthetase
MEVNGLLGPEMAAKRMIVMRAIDKVDRLGFDGVAQLLGEGRKDDSGDFTRGAGLNDTQINRILNITGWKQQGSGSKGVTNVVTLANLEDVVRGSPRGEEGIAELTQIHEIVSSAGYENNRIEIDPSIVRGLEYYTGPVFECELLMETKDENGKPVRFGSVGGGGRYDGLVARFTGQLVPATGFSMGVSRLYSALKLLGKTEDKGTIAPVVVLVMDKERQGDYQKMVQQLRSAGIRAEMYVGTSGMKAQMKYADKRGSPLVVIQGGDEKAKGEVTLKDLALGAQLASGVESREEYASQRLAQVSVPEAELVSAVKKMLERK